MRIVMLSLLFLTALSVHAAATYADPHVRRVEAGDVVVWHTDAGATIKIRLSTVACPPVETPAGKRAKEFTDRALQTATKIGGSWTEPDQRGTAWGTVRYQSGADDHDLGKELLAAGLALPAVRGKLAVGASFADLKPPTGAAPKPAGTEAAQRHDVAPKNGTKMPPSDGAPRETATEPNEPPVSLNDGAQKGNTKGVAAAIKAGASPADLREALVAACVGAQLETVKMLVAAKAEANYNAPIGCPLGLLAENGNPQAATIIAYLILEGGAFPDGPNKDGGPLYLAARAGQVANIKAFLGGGANVKILIAASQGKKLSQVAAEAKHPEAANLLADAESQAAAK